MLSWKSISTTVPGLAEASQPFVISWKLGLLFQDLLLIAQLVKVSRSFAFFFSDELHLTKYYFSGAIFVRRLCCIFRKYGHLFNLIDLLTMVNQEVSTWNTPDHKKQVSVISSSLTGKVEFRRKEDKVIEAVLNTLEHLLFEKTIEHSTNQLIVHHRLAFMKLNSLFPSA